MRAVLLIALLIIFVSSGVTAQITIYSYNPIVNTRIYPNMSLSPSLKTNNISVSTCPGEFVAATFVVNSSAPITSFLPKPGDLRCGNDVINSSGISIKIVKIWYQRGDKINAGGNPRNLIPELLVNDTNLIRTLASKNNTLRLTNGTYTVISHRNGTGETTTIKTNDSSALRALYLPANYNLQYWVTIHVPQSARSGTYVGNISLCNGTSVLSNVRVAVNVLSFVLPDPLVEYSIYFRQKLSATYPNGTLGQDYLSTKQLYADLQDMKNHGVANPTIYQPEGNLLTTYMRIRRNCSMSTKNCYSLGVMLSTKNITKLQNDEQAWSTYFNYSFDNYYFYGIDEKNMHNTTGLAKINATHQLGFKVFCAGSWLKPAYVDNMTGYYDLPIINSVPKRNYSLAYHNVSGKVGNYANPQCGEEKPLTFRINYGLLLWQNNYDVAMDYGLANGGGLVWNDWVGGAPTYYKQEVMAYPTTNGVIDTVQWEGFREGVNDVRFITKMQQTMSAASQLGIDTTAAQRYISRLKNTTLTTLDLNAVRNIVIGYIENLSFQPMVSGVLRLHMMASTSVQAGDAAELFIQLSNESGAPQTGLADNISCYVESPDGTLIVDGSHPAEDPQPGIYHMDFIAVKEGSYPCWVTYNGTLDAVLVQATRDVTGSNASLLSKRIGDLYSQGGLSRYMTTSQIVGMIAMQNQFAQNMSLQKQKTSILDSLVNTAISQGFQIIFWAIILTIISVFSYLMAARGRRRKQATKKNIVRWEKK